MVEVGDETMLPCTAQLSALWPAALFPPVRGNLDTRLRKLDEGQYSALVLAAAGLKRLGWESRISLALPLSACVPAPGQGIVAVEIRADDEPVRRAVAAISDSTAFAALDAERAVVVGLGGGCQTPIGALASPVDRETIELIGVVVAPDGSRIIRAAGRATIEDSGELGGRALAVGPSDASMGPLLVSSGEDARDGATRGD